MNHYDGPAFYRLKSLQKNKATLSKKVNRKKDISVHKSDQVTRQKERTKKDFDARQGISSRPFRPSYVPPSLLNLVRFDPSAKVVVSYERLCQELHKEVDDYYWLDFETETDLDEVDLTIPAVDHANDQVDQVEEIPETDQPDQEEVADDTLNTETFLPSSQLEIAENATDSAQSELEKQKQTLVQGTALKAMTTDQSGTQMTDQTEIEHEKAPVHLTQSFSDSTLDDDERISGANISNDDPSEKTATQNATQKQKNLASVFDESTNNDSIIETDDSVDEPEEVAKKDEEHFESKEFKVEKNSVDQSSQNTENLPQNSRALNRSLADIIDFEQNDQRDLSLFKEKNQTQDGTDGEALTEKNTYQFPDISLLPEPVVEDDPQMDEWVLSEADVLNETLQAFHVDGTVKDWTVGPTVTQFEITLGRGVKVNKVTNLTDDLKLALAAKDIRIEAPIPGKSSIGIEIPNKKSRPVMLREVLQSSAFQSARSPLTVALGVDLFGKPQVTNLKKMPHGLIAGATGSGKSVFINSLLVSILYKAKPSEVKLLLIDPKAVEMAPYQNIPHLLAPVVSDPKSAAAALKWVVKEMDERYERLAASGARNIDSFNEKAVAAGDFGLKMPYIVIVIDELADLMMVAASEVQDYIARITAKARAAGIHLLIATQRPSVDVVTGTIKNNIPTRVAFMVASQVDSRTILDSSGAERLLGKGDMLYLGNGAGQPIRLQGTFIDEEVDRITDFVRTQGQPEFAFDPDGLKEKAIESENEDELMPQVLDYIVNEEAISTSKLQRVFSVGYNRAASIVEDLEAKRYISEAKGSKPRDVFLTPEGLAKLRES
ncbi:DNA translocase FtsK [Ligilactobacillus pobuzihii]|uniref:DNA segregation ATPase FtsK SpoIIIE related protein n=1 Tax=Ligilactobacillus pobuzihii TaxID=449659 RepID=A0A0R2L562_9LACO|nr:DNA translocase FtsK [Ligilactobacillus pobuzihii]KRK09580.1 DNA segregation ATPase FtsK SpoIIIE related protein [Ligilactobacillus pobuzihii E100301 = KCTC 13174]KRN96496.1 DNA segregation ATPase FtsK SpoIIIE related protein [Ligilactobacillus pobuzihii]GEN48779.1 hypothetical protein LPO01_15710 [Ligilactobacillus pobuzihii]